MIARSVKLYSIALIIGDFFILLAAFSLAYVLRVQIDSRPLVNEVYAVDFFVSTLTIIPLWLIVFGTLGLYRSSIYNKRLSEFGRLFLGTFIGILIMIGFAFVIDRPLFPARLVAVYAFIGSFGLLVLAREFLRQLRTLLYRYGRGIRRVLLVGTSKSVADMAQNLDDTAKSGYKIVAIAGPKAALPDNFKGQHYSQVLSALKDLEKLRITTIVQTDLYDSSERNQKVLSAAQNLHISYSFIPGEPEFYSGKNTIDVFLGYPVISVHQTPLIGWGVIVKRLFDIIVGILITILISPFMLIVILLQKILNPGPMFYVSKRMTLYGRSFGFYKFRSMGAKYGGKDASEEFREMGREDLAKEYERDRKVKNDPRVTKFGNLLRKTSLDEFPQLINVIRGEMSLVGPRPILPQELKRYRSLGRGSVLHSVKPGMTGLWQVSGRSDVSFEQRIELEQYYAQNWSFWMDVKILFKTIAVIIGKGRGAR